MWCAVMHDRYTTHDEDLIRLALDILLQGRDNPDCPILIANSEEALRLARAAGPLLEALKGMCSTYLSTVVPHLPSPASPEAHEALRVSEIYRAARAAIAQAEEKP